MSKSSVDKILYGGPVPPSFDSESKSLGEIVLKKLAVDSDKVMFIDAVKDIELTRALVRFQVIQLIKSLSQVFGVKEGDVIGISSDNCLEYPIVSYATFCLGATIAPINVTYTDREMDHALNLSRPRLMFASQSIRSKAVKVAKGNRFIEKIILFDSEEIQRDDSIDNEIITFYSDLISIVKCEECFEFDCKPVDMKNNISMILCSSGTTGLPKGVALTQSNIIVALIQNISYHLTKDYLTYRRMLTVLPCSHVFGLMVAVGTPLNDQEIVILPRFEEHLFLKSIAKYKVNLTTLVPSLILFLAKSPLVDEYDLSSLKFVLSGAAPLSKELSDAVKSRLNLSHLLQGYGMSETTLGVTAQWPEFRKPGSVGILTSGTWGKVVDPDTGKALGPNQPGEMCFKGGMIMRGYVGNKAATDETIDADGWLHTGDIGYYDDDQEWFVVDRLKELIKYKGNQVPPAEIEAQLLTHPDINDAAVIGIPDEAAGELPLAFVVRKPNAKLTEKQVIDFVAETASPAKRLRGGVRFVEVIPKNPAGKILRRVLRDQIAKEPRSKL